MTNRVCGCGLAKVWLPVGTSGGMLALCPKCNLMELGMFGRRAEDQGLALDRRARRYTVRKGERRYMVA